VDLGFSQVIDFEGGIDEWEREGFPMRGTRALAPA
jgi:rhodanese-related sulfurtransferase